ncbi:MAG: hypothetical protein QXJ14_00425 [Candidatus Aenigmatarchaeota archaeon]
MKAILLLFLLFIFFSFAFSQYLSVGVDPVPYSVEIYNKNDKEEIFMISVFPQEIGGIKSVYNDRIWVAPKSSKIVNIFFVAPKCVVEEMAIFEIIIYPYSNPNEKIVKNITVLPKLESLLCLLPIKKSKDSLKPGEEFMFEITAKNLAKRDYDVIFKVYLNKEKKFEEIARIEKLSTITKSYSFKIDNNWNPGKYFVEIALLDTTGKIIDLKEEYFFVEESKNLDQYSSTSINFFFVSSTYIFKNLGNSPLPSFTYVLKFPSLISFLVKIDAKAGYEKVDGTFKINIPSLEKNSFYSFQLKILLYPIWLTAFFVIILISLVYWRYYTITINKILIGKAEEDIKIKIVVRNARRVKLRDVIVKDFVPSLFKISKDFEFFAPQITKKSFGFELSWNLGDLNPNEEVILAYKIKPIVELVGKFKLPKAVLRYREGKKIKTIGISKSISV